MWQPARSSRAWRGALLLAALLAALLGRRAGAAVPLTVSDADMGIHTYDTVVQNGKAALAVRVQLRIVCTQQQHAPHPQQQQQQPAWAATLHGFVAVFPLSTKAPVWSLVAPHYTPPVLAQQLEVSVTNRATGHATKLKWLGPPDLGFWRLRGRVQSAGPHYLSVAGGGVQHDLPHPLCPTPRRPGTPNLSDGFWNVLTTTSDSSIKPATLAFLVLEHNAYHRRLGFNGTILRSNAIESEALTAMPEVQAAIEHKGLIIWPWEQEHIASASTHYWQKPKNQLTLLGAYDRSAHLAYFDLDEYLVLPQGGDVRSARCNGRPLLDTGASGSWVVTRYQAKSCPAADGDLPCWQAGRGVSGGADISLLQDLCPMSRGHGKHIMLADRVDTMSVHVTFSEQHTGNRVANTSCAYLLHFYSLLEARRAGVTGMLRKMPLASWNVELASGRRVVAFPHGIAPLDHATCEGSRTARMDAIRRFKQLQQQHQRQHGGGAGGMTHRLRQQRRRRRLQGLGSALATDQEQVL